MEQVQKIFNEASKEPERKLWLPPSVETIQNSLIKGVSATIERARQEREDDIAGVGVSRAFKFSDISEIEHDIDGQIILRDFRLINQSDMLVAFIGLDDGGRPVISAGSQTEISYASEMGREVLVICRAKDKLSPWVTEMTTGGTKGVFRDVEEAIAEFRAKGYIIS